MSEAAPRRNWFDAGGQDYARFRPEYPPALAAYLAGVAPDRALAVDAGCGTGQLTVQLAGHFDRVVGVDASADQIEHAAHAANVVFHRAPAECMPIADRSASIVTAAQAAHWFDLPAFHAEVRRIGRPGAVVALISYGVPALDPAVDAGFRRFYRDGIGPYWPAERRMVDRGYADIAFPFAPLVPPTLHIRKSWSLADTLGYISTWSAVRRAAAAGRQDVLRDFATELRDAWGEPERTRVIAWPVNMRIGTV